LGRPEEVLPELARRVGAAAVYFHQEVTYEEMAVEARVKAALESVGAKVDAFWTNTLHHPDDLPFELQDLPQNFDRFKALVADAAFKTPLPAPRELPGAPVAGRSDPGEVPTLKELGLATPPRGAACDAPSCAGGEGEALRQLAAFASQAASPPPRSPAAVPVARACESSFSSRVAPWLATGCLSPRHMLQEMTASLNGSNFSSSLPSSASPLSSSSGGLKWVEFELLWRDFFRLLTRKHSEVALPARVGTTVSAAVLA
jgi:deoxyribodipyrimidine photo-lyase